MHVKFKKKMHILNDVIIVNSFQTDLHMFNVVYNLKATSKRIVWKWEI